jgi:hypothetical protein
MHIDAVQVAASAARTSLGNSGRASADARPAQKSSPPAQAPASLPKARELSVSASFIENQIIVYRFVDNQTGAVVQQIPPEELLQVMRSIDEMLNAENGPGQKLNIRS